jgi:hypothetical protein
MDEDMSLGSQRGHRLRPEPLSQATALLQKGPYCAQTAPSRRVDFSTDKTLPTQTMCRQYAIDIKNNEGITDEDKIDVSVHAAAAERDGRDAGPADDSLRRLQHDQRAPSLGQLDSHRRSQSAFGGVATG